MELCASPPAVMDAVSTRRRLISPPPTPDAISSALRDQPLSACALLPAEPIALDRKGLPLPSPLAAQLLALGLAVRRYDAGEDGSVLVATRRTEILERAPQPLCPCAEHHRASPSALHALRVERDAKPSACAMCGFVVPAASQWRCAACRAGGEGGRGGGARGRGRGRGRAQARSQGRARARGRAREGEEGEEGPAVVELQAPR